MPDQQVDLVKLGLVCWRRRGCRRGLPRPEESRVRVLRRCHHCAFLSAGGCGYVWRAARPASGSSVDAGLWEGPGKWARLACWRGGQLPQSRLLPAPQGSVLCCICAPLSTDQGRRGQGGRKRGKGSGPVEPLCSARHPSVQSSHHQARPPIHCVSSQRRTSTHSRPAHTAPCVDGPWEAAGTALAALSSQFSAARDARLE